LLSAFCLLPSALCLQSGCASAVQAGTNTALSGDDLVRVTDQMAMSIAADPDVASAVAREGKLVVVVQPVVNEMTAEVLPRGPSEAFMARVRQLLARQSPDRFTWVMNRDSFYRLRKQELDVDLGPPPERLQPRYGLTARFNSLTKEDAQRRSSYYLCTYDLTELETGKTLWTDKYETKKTAVKGFLD
jgi:PBP1b-binding outer membrane lipoprotein LpoB